jgi:hypothetical protein
VADNPQITQIYADSEVNKDSQTYAVVRAPSLEYKRLVFNLRESAQSAGKLKDLNLTGVQLG